MASGHRMTALANQDIPVPTRTQREPAAYRGTPVFSLAVGLWPGHAGPIGIDVIAV